MDHPPYSWRGMGFSPGFRPSCMEAGKIFKLVLVAWGLSQGTGLLAQATPGKASLAPLLQMLVG